MGKPLLLHGVHEPADPLNRAGGGGRGGKGGGGAELIRV